MSRKWPHKMAHCARSAQPTAEREAHKEEGGGRRAAKGAFARCGNSAQLSLPPPLGRRFPLSRRQSRFVLRALAQAPRPLCCAPPAAPTRRRGGRLPSSGYTARCLASRFGRPPVAGSRALIAPAAAAATATGRRQVCCAASCACCSPISRHFLARRRSRRASGPVARALARSTNCCSRYR